MDAASPATQHRDRTEYRPHPGDRHRLACPNPSCLNPDRLEIRYEAVLWTPAYLDAIDGITWPEIDQDTDHERVSAAENDRRLTGWRCDACDNAYTGPQPLNRLVRLP